MPVVIGQIQNTAINAVPVRLVDAAGNDMWIVNGQVVGASKAVTVAGSDGANLRFLSVDASGRLTLPAGAATDATLATLLSEGSFVSRINTLGQKTMATSTPVVLPSDMDPIPVSVAVTSGADIITEGADQLAVKDQEGVGLLKQLLDEMKKMNLYLEHMTGLGLDVG